METKVAYEVVANKLNQWYGMIRREEVENAKEAKVEIQQLLPIMEENQDLLLYFSLLDYRNEILQESFSDSNRLFKEIQLKKEEFEQTDSMIQYYYYFFSGMYAFYHKHFIEAINFYKKAEQQVKAIPDEIELAEFHHKLSIAYYHIKQNFFSLYHAEWALSVFEKRPDYLVREIGTLMILGANKCDLYRYQEADEHYQKALNMAKSINHSLLIGRACHNIGITYAGRKIFGTAEKYLRDALNESEHKQSIFGLRSMYMLAYVLYQDSRAEEARKWFQPAFDAAMKGGDDEYVAKLKLVHALYDDGNIVDIQHSIAYLEEQKLWIDVEELAQDVAEYYKASGNYQEATVYLEKVICAKNNMQKITEELI